MKLTCSNCGQTYNTKDLPPGVDWSTCVYCGHANSRLPIPAPSGKSAPRKGGVLRTIVLLLVFALPAVINYFEKHNQNDAPAIQEEQLILAHQAGVYLSEAQERYYDRHKTYTDNPEQLFSVTEPMNIEKGIAVFFDRADDSGFNLTVTVEGSDTAFTFQNIPPLHRAARSGDVDKVNNLVAGGAEINARDGSDRTPLTYARSFQHPEAEKALLAAGARE